MQGSKRCWLCVLVCVFCALAGVSPGQEAKDAADKSPPSLGANKDLLLVKKLLEKRREYQEALEALRAHYLRNNEVQKARWAEEELLQYHRVLKQVFIMELDVPPPTLKGTDNIPKANMLVRQAKGYKDKGFGTEYVDNQRRAELLLQRVLTDHSRSDKISEVAYHLGDLYEGRAYQQYARAAMYFERCYQWNSKTQYDARLRAARLYDRQLNNRGKAAEIYKSVMDTETDERRLDEAKRRHQELSGQR